MYLTYAEYTAYGGTLSSADFGRAEYRAETLIPAYVRRRIEQSNPIVEPVKRLMFELIDRVQVLNASASGTAHASESTDGVSVSYDRSALSGDMADSVTSDLIQDYLGNCYTADGVCYTYLGVW